MLRTIVCTISACFFAGILLTTAQAQPVVTSWYVIPVGYHLPNGSVYPRGGGMIAAHKTLPFNTRLLLTNPKNGKRVVVTVGDRGPHIRGRNLDISKKAAARLGIIHQGVARLEMKIESRPGS